MIGEALAACACPELAELRELLARIAGPIGEAARTAHAELARLDAKAARAKRAAWAAAARAPLPPGMRGIDPSWIEAALVELPARARAALAGASVAQVPADVWLARRACAALPAMPPIEVALTRPRSSGDVASLSGPALRGWLEDVGADQLAFALGAQAAGTLGPRLVAASARIALAPRAGELGDRRAAIERARIAIDDRALARIGARSLAPHTGAAVRAQLAHRLPRELGLVILAELDAFAGSPLAGAPSWRALAAP